MEVHHHPNVEKKRFKEYFLEFLMIFLAVTLGFFAENIREHYSAREIEKQSMKSLTAALASDTVQLENIITANRKVLRHLDSVVKMRHADLTNLATKKLFLQQAIVGFSEDWYFIPNDAALQQLKSSGTLRLVRHQNVIDSIFKYELNNKALARQQEDCYVTFQSGYTDFRKAIGLFFYRDTSVMIYSLGYDNSDAEFKNVDEIEISHDKEQVKALFGDAAGMAATIEAYIFLMKNQLEFGKNVIAFLKDEYDIGSK